MVEHAGRTLPEGLEMRYDLVKEKVKILEAGGTVAEDVEGENLATLQTELGDFGDGPTDNLAPGSPERTAWFSNWLADRCSKDANDDAESQFLARGPAQMQANADDMDANTSRSSHFSFGCSSTAARS